MMMMMVMMWLPFLCFLSYDGVELHIS